MATTMTATSHGQNNQLGIVPKRQARGNKIKNAIMAMPMPMAQIMI